MEQHYNTDNMNMHSIKASAADIVVVVVVETFPMLLLLVLYKPSRPTTLVRLLYRSTEQNMPHNNLG